MTDCASESALLDSSFVFRHALQSILNTYIRALLLLAQTNAFELSFIVTWRRFRKPSSLRLVAKRTMARPSTRAPSIPNGS
jgi:hypothetical protein